MIDILEKKHLLDKASSVIQTEIEALMALKQSLGDDFLKAIQLIHPIKGRIIISGMGKSGHIGAKIAATLASTGTPSFFLHPSEASHGDLGMVTKEDLVICLSNSGETAELSDLIAFTRRHTIPLIGIISKANSLLAKQSDIALVIPKMPEACPNGLAPTTSTTMMLVLGDALAVSLMHLKGFTSDHFHNFHPGGKLGARLMKIADLMHVIPDIPLVQKTDLMKDVILEMTTKSFGCVGVMDTKGAFVGVITDGDLRRHMSDDFMIKKAEDIMSDNPVTLTADKLVAEAVSLFENNSITAVFILDGKRPIGLLHIHDCLRVGMV